MLSRDEREAAEAMAKALREMLSWREPVEGCECDDCKAFAALAKWEAATKADGPRIRGRSALIHIDIPEGEGLDNG